MKTRLIRIGIPVVTALFLILALAMPVSAAATVTPAGGGDPISADDFGTGAWTTLTAIVITEGAVGDIAVGDFVLTIPSGFEFDTASVPDVVVTGAGLAANSPAVITATTITVTVTSASSAAGTLTIGGVTPIKVRPIQGTPLESGNILMTSGTIAGVDGTTNFGTLNEVHGAATKFVIIDPTDGTVDAPITATVQLQDQYGNIVTTGGDKDKDVTLTADGSATGAGLVDLTDGVGTIDISDQVAETVNLGLTDSENTLFDVTSTQDVVFAHGAATKFVIIDPTDGTVDAPITVTVQLQDQYGNIVTSGGNENKDVTLTADGSATGAGLVDIINGVGTIDISDQVAETVNLGLTDSENTLFDVTSTQDVVFAVGAINYYTVTSVSYSQVAGVAFTVTVTAYDQYGNLVTTDSTTQVTMSSSSAIMAFDGDGDGTFGEVGDDSKILAAGTFDIQARDTTAGTGVTITATDPNTKTGTSSPYTIYALGGGGGGGFAPQPSPPPSPTPLELEMNLWDDITSVDIDEDGVLLEGVTATSPDGRVTLTIAEGTQVLGPDGDPLVELSVETILDSPDAPEGYHVIVAFDFGPDGTTFNPSIEITIEYDLDALPEGVDESNLVIAYHDEAAGEWVFVTGEVDPAANTVTFSAGHFTTFAILGAAAPEVLPAPAPSSTSEGGLSGGLWAGIGIGIVGLIGLSIGLIIRRR